jgi:hypothetical protein
MYVFVASNILQIHRYVTPGVSCLLVAHSVFPVAEINPMRKVLHAGDLGRDRERPFFTAEHKGELAEM